MIKCMSFLICLCFIVGCSTPTHKWPDQDRGMVWTAMVAAANSPEYTAGDLRRRWIVAENFVEADAQKGHIQIHRVLTRSLKLPLQEVQHDRRQWCFDIYLLPDDPPSATFGALDVGFIPSQLHDEADRYFLLVDEVLHRPQE